MSSMKRNFGILTAMSLMMGSNPSLGQDLDASDINVSPKEKRPPKGCKEYFFNTHGDYSTDKMLKSETVFKCFAINDNHAIRKFNTFKKSKN